MNNHGSEPRFLISAIASILHIHPQTLRLYEKCGLIQPSRSEGNTRLYSEKDIEQIKRILNLTRDMGINLAGVEVILNLRRQIEEMQCRFKGYFEKLQSCAMNENKDFFEFIRRFLSESPVESAIHPETCDRKDPEG